MKTPFCRMFTSFAAVLSMASAFAGTDPLGTVQLTPLGLDHDETPVVERIEKIHEISGISNFALHGPGHLVRLDGVKKVDDYRGYGEKIARIRKRLAKKGIECGYLIHPSINMGIRHPGCDYLNYNGTVRPFTGCSYDPDFRAAFVSNITALAAAGKPPFIMIEDDFRYFLKGCFCKRHLEGFSKLTGRTWTRESLAKAIDADAKLKKRWHDWQMSSLVSLAAELSASVAKVNPGCRFGTCAPWGVREEDTLKVANAAAGKQRAFIRWYGTSYGCDNPQDVFWFLRSAQYARENVNDGHEYFYEADTVPHTVLFASAARTTALMSLTFAMGFDRMWFWGAGSGPLDLEMCPDYLKAYRENVKAFVEIRRMGKIGRPAGLRVGQWSEWYHVLNRLGYPVVTCDARVRFFDGPDAFAEMDDDAVRKALSGRVFLDGEAAEAAVKRGFGDLIGLKVNEEKRGITFSGEHTSKGTEPAVRFPCSFHANYGLDGSRVCDLVLDGAEELTYFFRGRVEVRDRPAIVRIENRLGGRVVTMAVTVRGLTSPNIFNYPKRRLIHDLLKWLGGESVVPAHVFNAPKVYLLARESEKTLFLHGVNLSCDPVQDLVLDLSPEWIGAGVEILGQDGVWRKARYSYRDGRLHVETGGVQVFRYFDLRLSK